MVVPGRLCVLLQFFIYSSLFQREISEDFRPITTKFCTMLGSMFNFIMQVQKLEVCPLPPQKKNWGGEKCTKFGVISDLFQL